MAQQMIRTGAAANDGTGDTLQAAGGKINSMFTELYGASASPALPLVLSQFQTMTAVVENVSVAANTPVTILNVTGGPGVVDEIWWAVASAAGGLDGVISVYVDGETTPSVTFDANMLGLAYAGNCNFSNRNLEIQRASWGVNCVFRFPIPYKASCKVTWSYTAATTGFFSIAYYRPGESLPYKLQSSGMTYINRMKAVTAANQGNGTIQYLNLPAGSAGWVVFHCLSISNANDLTPLETNPVMYLDGLAPGSGVVPQFNSSGTEDYFDDFAYFANGVSANLWKIASAKASGGSGGSLATMSINFLEKFGDVKFTNGILMRAEQGLASSPGTVTSPADVAWLVLYYVPNP